MSELVKSENQLGSIENVTQWSQNQIKLIKSIIFIGASDDELILFAEICKSRKLNPFNKEIYAIKRGDKATFQTSIDGFRIIAKRTGEYLGQTIPLYCGSDSQWVDVWIKNEPPLACKIGVYVKGFAEPVYAVGSYREYVNQSNPIWRKMPTLMLAKCVESLALRKAFPEALSGLYSDEEMSQADIDLNQRSIEAKKTETHTPRIVEVKKQEPLPPKSICDQFRELIALKMKNLTEEEKPSMQDKLFEDINKHLDQAYDGEIKLNDWSEVKKLTDDQLQFLIRKFKL